MQIDAVARSRIVQEICALVDVRYDAVGDSAIPQNASDSARVVTEQKASPVVGIQD